MFLFSIYFLNELDCDIFSIQDIFPIDSKLTTERRIGRPRLNDISTVYNCSGIEDSIELNSLSLSLCSTRLSRNIERAILFALYY